MTTLVRGTTSWLRRTLSTTSRQRRLLLKEDPLAQLGRHVARELCSIAAHAAVIKRKGASIHPRRLWRTEGVGGVRAGAEVNGHGQPSWRGLPSVWERVKVPSGVDVDESSATPRGGSRGDCVGGSEMHRCRGMARPAPVIMRIGMGDGVVPALAKIYVGHPLGRRVASPCRAAESSEGRSRPCTAGEAGGASGGGAL